MSNGTYKTDEHTYKYRLVISGRGHGAIKDSTFVFLSNIPEITFDRAWQSIWSSNSDAFFDESEAILVE